MLDCNIGSTGMSFSCQGELYSAKRVKVGVRIFVILKIMRLNFDLSWIERVLNLILSNVILVLSSG